ncbi:hypothetical protein FEM03_02360 [Phragmitibacter flavus]|uniref:Cytochrome c assembly protein domain-containing protein n=1 Tax=Phragmitibacter flavus TaxID=2576071 RepID=A0A5R8KIY4_9BACT|nr:cytochrome c biogenesis protein CcsA [Phragmitibacter flavus]TLD72220.1 hypothetical protein FEM03_02360 [Phragmitibacter flavus]
MMESSRLLLLLAMFVFAGGFAHALWSIRAGSWKESRWHLLPMVVGFGLQCAFLAQRGEVHGRCPLTNLPEVFVFIGWCIVLLYFLVGAAYRLSLLGVFTAPLVALLMLPGFFTPMVARPLPRELSFWEHLHAPLAMIGYAAFALACISGVMFLIQDFLLKKHKIHALFYQLPPIHHLSKAIVRMVGFGVLVLAAMMGTTFLIEEPISGAKMVLTWGVLGIYAAIWLLMLRHTLSGRLTAWLAVLGFLLPLGSLWIVA